MGEGAECCVGIGRSVGGGFHWERRGMWNLHSKSDESASTFLYSSSCVNYTSTSIHTWQFSKHSTSNPRLLTIDK